jgi:branched-chain amino acid transport system ATP-binding protein
MAEPDERVTSDRQAPPSTPVESGMAATDQVDRDTTTTAPLLEVTGLEVTYQDVIQALRGITIRVEPGAIVAILGPNGAGKTTALRAITGLLDFHKGEVVKGTLRFDGHDLTSLAPARIVGLGVAQVMEGRRIFATMTVEENLRTAGFGDTEALDEVITRFPRLGERRRQLAGYLSGGEQQMLAIGRALMTRPRLLVLDEPSLGLAPLLVEAIAEAIAEIRDAGTTVLLVEQNTAVALDLANHGYVIENGRVVMDADSRTLREDPDIMEFYLGRQEGGERRHYADVKHYRRRKRWLS